MKTGYAIGEMESLKKIMLSTATNFGGEFFVRENMYLNVSPGISTLQFSHTDSANASVFNKKTFLDFSISLKKYYRLSKNSSAFWDFGICGDYFFRDKREINAGLNNSIFINHNLGFNFGTIASFGFKTLITNKLAFDVAIFVQQDEFFIYKINADKIKTTRNFLVFSFYREFEK